MNIGFGCSQLSAEVEASIRQVTETAGLTLLDESGFHAEYRDPIRRTFAALGYSEVFALNDRAGSQHAPEPEDARDAIRAIAGILASSGATGGAVTFVVEYEEEPRYASGSPADLDRLIETRGWKDTRMRFSERDGLKPFYLQESDDVPFVFRVKPTSA